MCYESKQNSIYFSSELTESIQFLLCKYRMKAAHVLSDSVVKLRMYKNYTFFLKECLFIPLEREACTPNRVLMPQSTLILSQPCS